MSRPGSLIATFSLNDWQAPSDWVMILIETIYQAGLLHIVGSRCQQLNAILVLYY